MEENKNQRFVIITAIDVGCSNNPRDTEFSFWLQCILDNDNRIMPGHWYGIVKERDIDGDLSKFPFVLSENSLDYGSAIRSEGTNLRNIPISTGEYFTRIIDEDERTHKIEEIKLLGKIDYRPLR
ncbi:hypothetical protein AB4090_02505 [Acidithiobacillus sp. IBUN Pt1247-S3]|uniref:hypothetical protein n=1 Tax=Acidithiobacillus sp. IBUN Pt1247-S3 TaxID=3166642 RepID=UPI0034E46FCC